MMKTINRFIDLWKKIGIGVFSIIGGLFLMIMFAFNLWLVPLAGVVLAIRHYSNDGDREVDTGDRIGAAFGTIVGFGLTVSLVIILLIATVVFSPILTFIGVTLFAMYRYSKKSTTSNEVS